jgi:hypothetical protein
MAPRRPAGDPAGMKKRALASMLWFYSIWYAGAMIASALGISPALGPILGAAAAAIVAVDPRGLFWARPADPRSSATISSAQAVQPLA